MVKYKLYFNESEFILDDISSGDGIHCNLNKLLKLSNNNKMIQKIVNKSFNLLSLIQLCDDDEISEKYCKELFLLLKKSFGLQLTYVLLEIVNCKNLNLSWTPQNKFTYYPKMREHEIIEFNIDRNIKCIQYPLNRSEQVMHSKNNDFPLYKFQNTHTIH